MNIVEEGVRQEYGKDQIVAFDDKGNKYFMPKTQISVENRDFLARLAAAGSLLVAAGALGYALLAPRGEGGGDAELEARVKAVQTQQAENILGDCINENIIRQLVGEKMLTLGQCIQEREDWSLRLENAATPTPSK